MTIEDLNQLQYLQKFIDHERDRLEAMRESLDAKSPVISDMPKTPGASDMIGDTIPNIIDEATRIEESLAKYTEMQERLLTFIHQVPNLRIKMLMTLRFVDGLTWDEVADYADNGNGKCTADNVRMAVNNYINRTGDHAM